MWRNITSEDIDRIVTYHLVNEKAVTKITDLRMQAHAMMNLILARVPDCDEKEQALAKVQEVLFWSVAGIARDPENWDEDE